MPNVVTADAQGNLQCAAPIESVMQQSSAAIVAAVDVTYTPSSGSLAISVQDITGAIKQDSVTLPTSTQNISTWANGTTQAIVLGSDGKLYLANPTGAPSTHNPVSKTNNVDWFGAFTTLNDLLQYALSGGSFLATSSSTPTYTKQDTAPTSPTLGDKWYTTDATTSPYAKNVAYEFDGASWKLCLGAPSVGCASAEIVPVIDGTGLHGLPLTLGDNTLNATVSGQTVTINNDGFYTVIATILPGSVTRVIENLGERPARISIMLMVDGAGMVESYDTYSLGWSAASNTEAVFSGGMSPVVLQGFFPAGTTFGCAIGRSHMGIDTLLNLRVTQVA